MAYSIDYKKRAIEYKDEGHTFAELREVFKIPSATYYDWKEKLEKGILGMKVKRTRNRKIDAEKLKQAIKETPDAYLEELAKPFDCTPQAVFYALIKMNYTYKKRRLHTLKNPKN